MTLLEQHNSIQSREDLVAFIKALRKDLNDDPQSWENDSLERFLESLGSWLEDMDGFYTNQKKPIPNQPDWKVVGDMLIAAKMYE